jgi:hypothetical protein
VTGDAYTEFSTGAVENLLKSCGKPVEIAPSDPHGTPAVENYPQVFHRFSTGFPQAK